MEYIDGLLDELSARLPELEWKISRLSPSTSGHSLPRGLFRPSSEFSPAACIEEIKSDIQTLGLQTSQFSATWLAERIHRKISVLVSLCQIQNKKNKPEERVYFGMKMLSTRQQWIQDLEHNVTTLTSQHRAVSKTLEQMKNSTSPEALLNVQAELGELERRLTIARETLARAVT